MFENDDTARLGVMLMMVGFVLILLGIVTLVVTLLILK